MGHHLRDSPDPTDALHGSRARRRKPVPQRMPETCPETAGITRATAGAQRTAEAYESGRTNIYGVDHDAGTTGRHLLCHTRNRGSIPANVPPAEVIQPGE